jgi:hypothetical protein
MRGVDSVLALAALLLLGLGAGAAAGADTFAQARPGERDSLFELVIGAPIATQQLEFQEFACGTDGGPPSRTLKGFGDFAECPAEAATGLHEVQFRYDDEIEYRALALGQNNFAERFHGTKIGSFEVIVSALIDDAGILRGWRAVTDDRASLRGRSSAYQMGEYIRVLVKAPEWTCIDLPPAEGQTPVAGRLINENCRGTTTTGNTALVETRLLRRKGQRMIDPFSGVYRNDRFISTTRVEVLDASVPVPADLGSDR